MENDLATRQVLNFPSHWNQSCPTSLENPRIFDWLPIETVTMPRPLLDVNQLSHYRNHYEDEDMKTVFAALLQDDHGFIVSAELVLIATLLVIGLIVGLSEVQYAVVEELNDISDAIGSLNQSYYFSGFSACKPGGGLKSKVVGSAFNDTADTCDNNQCQIACDSPVPEGPKYGGGHYGY